MSRSREPRHRRYLLFATALVGLAGVALLRAAFLPAGRSFLAPVAPDAELRSKPAAVFGYFVFVGAGILVIVATGKMRPRIALAIGEITLALVAAGAATIALASAWIAIAAAVAGIFLLEMARRRCARTGDPSKCQ